LLSRGELSKPRGIVAPALPASLGTGSGNANLSAVPATQRRAALARWLTSPGENPLTARVIVNRVWGWHFGNGLVRTPNDFGTQGERPTHPQLLDWLARDFTDHGWDLKRLHRLIMTSSTYQMLSTATGRGLQIDPENRLLSHFPRHRLEGEIVWDNLHACADTLNPKQFGPPVVPPLTQGELMALFNNAEKWKVTRDPAEINRRGIYLYVRRTFLFPMFDAFDAADVMASCPSRQETTVPAQALTMLNSQAIVAQSRAFAQRLLRECGDDLSKVLPHAWWTAYGRPITKAETGRALLFLRQRQADLASTQSTTNAEQSVSSIETALTELCLALFNTNEFNYID